MKVKKGLTLLAGAAITATVLVSPAPAHTSLREANPADKSTVDGLPAEIIGLTASPIREGALQVFDPCGKSVTTGDTEVEAIAPRPGQPEVPGSRLTVPVEGERPGTYQVIWSALPLDGENVAGLWTFNVEDEGGCTTVTRTDAEDNENGIDITKVTTKKLPKGKLALSLTSKDAIDVSALSKAIDDDDTGTVLDVTFENNQDDAFDFRGRFVKARGGVAMLLTSDDLETKYGRFVATAKGTKLSVEIPSKVVRPAKGNHLDVAFQTIGNTEDCGEAGCFDAAPDLGFLRALSR